MRLSKVAVASVNTTVGAVKSNTDRCIAMAHEMAAADVTIATFPEQVVGGYAPEDLVQWPGFVAGPPSKQAPNPYHSGPAAADVIHLSGLRANLDK